MEPTDKSEIAPPILFSLNSCYNVSGFYSCSIDTVLDLFCYALLPNMTDSELREMRGSRMFNEVVECYHKRTRCSSRTEWSELRDGFWDVVCADYPSSFCPKGTIRAGIDVIFNNTEGLSSFRTEMKYICANQACKNTFNRSLGMICLGFSDAAPGLQVDDAVNLHLGMRQRKCAKCLGMLDVSLQVPKFLVVSLPLIDTQRGSSVSLTDVLRTPNGQYYELIATIHATGNHFFPVVKLSREYAVLDDLNRNNAEYWTFEQLQQSTTTYFAFFIIRTTYDVCAQIVNATVLSFREEMASEPGFKAIQSKCFPTTDCDQAVPKCVEAVVDEIHIEKAQRLVESIGQAKVEYRRLSRESSSDASNYQVYQCIEDVVNEVHKDAHQKNEQLLIEAEKTFYDDIDPTFSPCTTCGMLIFPEERYGRKEAYCCYGCHSSSFPPEVLKQYYDSMQTGVSSLLDQLNMFEKRFLNKINVHTTFVNLSDGQLAGKALAVHFLNNLCHSTIECPQSFKQIGLVLCENSRNRNKPGFLRIELLYRCFRWLKQNNIHFMDTDLSWITFWRARVCGSEYSESPDVLEVGLIEDNYRSPTVKEYVCQYSNLSSVPKITLDKTKSDILKTWQEDMVEEKGFVSLFPCGSGGFRKKNDICQYFQRYCRWRLLNFANNRFRKHIPYLFWCISMYQYDRLLSQVNVSLRSGKTTVLSGLAASGKRLSDSEASVVNDILNDTYFSFFSGIRGTTGYWNTVMLNLLAKVRTLGPPFLFVTLSADDNGWFDVRCLLDLEKSNSEQSSLSEVGKNPVICAKQFSRRWKAIFKWLKRTCALGRITDYFARVEFQNRGSPHLHIFLWIEAAPTFDTPEGRKLACEWIKRHISTLLPQDSCDRELVAKYQTHRHAAYCQTKDGKCRFKYPRRWCKETHFLDIQNIRKGKEFYETERDKDSIFVNPYNLDLLKVWRANMDIQLIGNYYGICAYVCAYVCKSEPKEMGQTVNKLIDALRDDGDLSARQILLKFGNAVLSNRIISAQEAAFFMLGLKLVDSSRFTQFIDCNFAECRRKVFKKDFLKDNANELLSGSIERLNMGSAFQNGVIDYYKLRPTNAQFERLTLGQFASWYRITGERGGGSLLLDGSTRIQKRRTMACVRTNHVSLAKNPERYYLRLLMLHYPFRDEHELINGFTSAFESFRSKMDRMNPADIESEYLLDDLVGAIQQMRAFNAEEKDDDESLVTAPPNEHNNVLNELTRYKMSESEYAAKQELLSSDQRKVFQYIRGKLIDQSKGFAECPIKLFISGQAGTGKSFLIDLMCELTDRIFKPVNKVSVLRAAFTGSASRNIRGLTLHKSFYLPLDIKRFTEYKPLPGEQLHELQCIYKELKLVVIDEISMVSLYMLCFVHRRLCDIFRTDQWFGGINMIVLGDFYQVKPVMAPFLFQKHEHVAFNLFTDVFLTTEIRTIMRQKDDPEYGQLCSRVRTATFTRDDVETLASRLNVHVFDNSFKNALWVFPRRQDVAAHNTECLSNLVQEAGVEKITIRAIDSVVKVNFQTNSLQKTDLAEQIEIAKGAMVMLIRAIPGTELTNGTIGTVVGFDNINSTNGCVTVKFSVDGNNIIEHVKRISTNMLSEAGKPVHRCQFPLMLCWAATIHKIQGQTVPKLVADLGTNIFQPALAYVALTRVRRLMDISFIQFTPKSLYCFKCVTRYYENFTDHIEDGNNFNSCETGMH